MFKFYYEIDLDRFLDRSPWTFNNHMLVYHRLQEGDDSMKVSLFLSNFWVQVHDLLTALMFDTMPRQFVDFMESFLEYDAKSLQSGYGGFMRIWICLDVRNSLMRKNKLLLGRKGSIYVRFRYERIPFFYFLCS